MRLSPRTPPTPETLTYDVVISQAVGKFANGFTVRNQPTGGSEWQVVILAEALAARGFKTAVLTPDGAHCRYADVDYIPFTSLLGAYEEPTTGARRNTVSIKTEVLVSERFGPLPPNLDFARIVFDLHDLPDARLEGVMQTIGSVPDSQIVVHSQFMTTLLTEWPRVSVIPCMVPDEFYGPGSSVGGEHRGNPSVAGSSPAQARHRIRNYVYGSAAMKGLSPTMQLWNELKKKSYHFKKATLTITSPGYDDIDPKLLDGAKDVRIYHGLSPAGMQELLAASDGIFMVSSYPETFGIVFHQCEIAGKPARVLQVHGNDDALSETLSNVNGLVSNADELVAEFAHDDPGPITPHDFSVTNVMPHWLEVLGLNQKENA